MFAETLQGPVWNQIWSAGMVFGIGHCVITVIDEWRAERDAKKVKK